MLSACGDLVCLTDSVFILGRRKENPLPGSLYRGSLYRGSLYRGSLYRGSLYRGSLYRGPLYRGSLHVQRSTVQRSTVQRFTVQRFSHLFGSLACLVYVAPGVSDSRVLCTQDYFVYAAGNVYLKCVLHTTNASF